jgi:hypothetical protein
MGYQIFNAMGQVIIGRSNDQKYNQTFVRLKALNELNDKLTQIMDLHTELCFNPDVQAMLSDENYTHWNNIDTCIYELDKKIRTESEVILNTLKKNNFK